MYISRIIYLFFNSVHCLIGLLIDVLNLAKRARLYILCCGDDAGAGVGVGYTQRTEQKLSRNAKSLKHKPISKCFKS